MLDEVKSDQTFPLKRVYWPEYKTRFTLNYAGFFYLNYATFSP